MAFWTSEVVGDRVPAEGLIEPYDHRRIRHGAYELAMGPEAYVTGSPQKLRLDPGQEVVIPPGQFALLLTEESVTVPPNAIGFISIKAGVKFRGLVNVSGFHVDPGFTGRLKFSVYNAGSRDVILIRGDPLFPVWFADLTNTTADSYDGSHRGQTAITSQDIMNMQGTILSPSALQRSFEDVQKKYDAALETIRRDVATGLDSAREQVGSLKQLTYVTLAALLASVLGIVLWVASQAAQIGELKGSLAHMSKAQEDVRAPSPVSGERGAAPPIAPPPPPASAGTTIR